LIQEEENQVEEKKESEKEEKEDGCNNEVMRFFPFTVLRNVTILKFCIHLNMV
jgi:hypothetical protein